MRIPNGFRSESMWIPNASRVHVRVQARTHPRARTHHSHSHIQSQFSAEGRIHRQGPRREAPTMDDELRSLRGGDF